MTDPDATDLAVGQVWSPRRSWASGLIPDRTILAVKGDRVEWENCLFRAWWSISEFRQWIKKSWAHLEAAKELNHVD